MVAVVHVGVREVFRPAARVAHLWPGWGSPRRHACLPACLPRDACFSRAARAPAGPTAPARRMHHAIPTGEGECQPRARQSSWAHLFLPLLSP